MADWWAPPQRKSPRTTEKEREDLAREHTCPTCKVPRKKPCIGGAGYSHTSRYLKAARKGKVPALPGVDLG